MIKYYIEEILCSLNCGNTYYKSVLNSIPYDEIEDTEEKILFDTLDKISVNDINRVRSQICLIIKHSRVKTRSFWNTVDRLGVGVSGINIAIPHWLMEKILARDGMSKGSFNKIMRLGAPTDETVDLLYGYGNFINKKTSKTPLYVRMAVRFKHPDRHLFELASTFGQGSVCEIINACCQDIKLWKNNVFGTSEIDVFRQVLYSDLCTKHIVRAFLCLSGLDPVYIETYKASPADFGPSFCSLPTLKMLAYKSTTREDQRFFNLHFGHVPTNTLI